MASFPKHYKQYISNVEHDCVQTALEHSRDQNLALLSGISSSDWKESFRRGKWTIAQVIQHIIDVERVMSFRALSILRGQKVSLPGFDHQLFAAATEELELKKSVVTEEYELVRGATIQLIKSANEASMEQLGEVNKVPLTPSQIFNIIAGHEIHHINILQDRYL